MYHLGGLPPQPRASEIVDDDVDGDGHWDFRNHLVNGEIQKVESDSDDDGRPDIIQFYTDGLVSRMEEDEDLDGVIDMWAVLKDGIVVQYNWDLDGDRTVDVITLCENGRPYCEQFRTRDGAVFCVSFPRKGRERIEYHDRNRDGRFESIARFDVFGFATSETVLNPPLDYGELGDLKARAKGH